MPRTNARHIRQNEVIVSDFDGLLQMCCAVPTDAVRRLALADLLDEMGEGEVAAALRAESGELRIRGVHRIADTIKVAPALWVLKAEVHLHPYMLPPMGSLWVPHVSPALGTVSAYTTDSSSEVESSKMGPDDEARRRLRAIEAKIAVIPPVE